MVLYSPIVTGSLLVSGSVQVTGSLTAPNITGSLFGTSSWASNATTASFVLNAVSSSFATSASNSATASFVLNAVSSSFATSASNSATASFVLNATTASFSTTASFVTSSNVFGPFGSNSILSSSYAFTASYALIAGGGAGFPFSGSAVITGSLLVSQSFVDFTQATYVSGTFTGPLIGTSSWSSNAISSSFAATASSADDFLVRQNATASNLLVNNTITAQTLVVQTITSSVDFVTGSTRFGSLLTNTHQFTGSVSITGSLTVTGVATINNLTGSLFGTASWANNSISSSFATSASNASTASFVLQSVSSSFATSASLAQTASFVLNAVSASFASTASSVNILNQPVSISGSFTVITGSGVEFQVTNIGTKIGNLTSDFHSITGSIYQSGSSVGASLRGSGSAIFSVDGTVGRLFQVDDSLSGSLFSVNTAAGLPIIEAFSDNTVRIAQFGQRAFFVSQSVVGIGKESALNGKLDVSGSTFITGSLNVSQGITGSLFGTSSWALNATTASFVLNAVSASFASTASSVNTLSQTVILTGSLNTTGSVFLRGLTSSSFANVVGYDVATGQLYFQSTGSGGGGGSSVTASFALTASAATDFTVRNTLTLDRSLMDYATVASSIVGSNNLFTQATGSYSSAFFKYTAANGANARSGEVMAVWNVTSVQFTDNSTLDIGSTTPVTCSVSVVGTDIQFNVQTNTSGWAIKSVATYM